MTGSDQLLQAKSRLDLRKNARPVHLRFSICGTTWHEKALQYYWAAMLGDHSASNYGFQLLSNFLDGLSETCTITRTPVPRAPRPSRRHHPSVPVHDYTLNGTWCCHRLPAGPVFPTKDLGAMKL